MGIDIRQRGRIPKEVAEVLPQLCGKTRCEDWVMAGSPMQRRDCRIYFLKSEGFRLPGLVLKIYRKDAVGKNLARNLHRKSRQLRKVATPECTIPEPVLFLQDENAMAMEFVAAPIAGSLLMKGFHSKEKRHAIIRKAASWLSWFHGHSGVAEEPFEAAAYTGKLAKTLEKIGTLTPKALPRDGFLRECLDFAEKVAAGLDGITIPHATAHGDFTPFNLFIDGGKTIGFDYRANRRLPIYHDICRFLVYLDVYRLTPASAGDLRQYGCRKEDFDVFMEAYGKGSGAVDERLWLKLQFLEVTRRITSLTLPRARVRNRIFRFIEMGHLRRNARHILNALR